MRRRLTHRRRSLPGFLAEVLTARFHPRYQDSQTLVAATDLEVSAARNQERLR